MNNKKSGLAGRFRGFLPVVIDVECGGIDPSKHALLELAAISINMDGSGLIYPDLEYHYHIEPYPGLILDKDALAFNKIDPTHPFRFALTEKQALTEFFAAINSELINKQCNRAVVVGHNAWFDQQFLNAAISRNGFKQSPFHRFTSLDTATLGALIYGQTVLSKALEKALIPYNTDEAHSAIYDAKCTAELFCKMVNKWKELGGWLEN